MFSDIITPKSFPEKLREVGYDPFDLMPQALPPHPRVMVNAAQIERTRALVKECRWAGRAFEMLRANARRDSELPAELPAPADADLNDKALSAAQRHALAWLLNGEPEHRDQALHAFRLLARGYLSWPLTGSDARAVGGGLRESRFNLCLGQTYDLLAAAPLNRDDDALFRATLEKSRETSDGCQHHTCGNHNTWSIAGRLAVAAALGHGQGIHDALYGCPAPRGWRYGIVHQFRHDILSDGVHWERTPGYHFYTMMAVVEITDILAHIGVDLWHKELPTQHQSDGHDHHRAYEPTGVKCVKAMLDAPFHQMFSNCDLSLLHDSGLANLRGAWIWGIIYNLGYEAYGDPKYAWLLNRMESDYPGSARTHQDLPMPLNTDRGDVDFVRLGRATYPAGQFSLKPDCSISLRGRHENGCSLFPIHGSAILRSDPGDERSVNAFLFWGPHSAGHMNPAALHLDIVARNRRITDAPRSGGYGDPLHLTWSRTTIAQDTVTVDEQSMFPYDYDTDAMWEADLWRDRVSDGVLECFQPGREFKAVRASNETVYEGVRLDRTVIVTGQFVLDVYRVLSDREHQYDWTMHGVGHVAIPTGAKPFSLGTRRGYAHFSGAHAIPTAADGVDVLWTNPKGKTRALVIPPPNAQVVLANDPPPGGQGLGELEAPGPRSSVIVRCRADRALFLSLWTFDESLSRSLRLVSGAADSDVAIETRIDGRVRRWRFPFGREPIQVES